MSGERAAGASEAARAAGLSALGRFAITAGGLGLLRPAPGTWGSLPPLVMVLLLLALGAPTWLIAVVMAAGAIKFSIFCLWFGDGAERAYGRKDPSQVVADEVAGQCVALVWLPWSTLGGAVIAGELTTHQAAVAVSAFLLFRILDIIKPPPAHGLQRLKGGAGILVDDLLAGLYALGGTWLVVLAINRWWS